MKTLELTPFKSTRGPFGSEPYVIAFVYPKNEAPIMIKGMLPKVKQYVKNRYSQAFYNLTMWKNGKTRGSWRFTCKGKYVFRKKGKWEVSIFKNKELIREFSLKRMPHRWIPEFDA